MLAGKELLNKIKELRGQEREEIALATGYSKRGKPDVLGLLEAIAEAKGVSFTDAPRKGKQASYLLTVHTTGQVVVGANYIKELGLQTGDWLRLEIKKGTILLTPTDPPEIDATEQVEEEEMGLTEPEVAEPKTKRVRRKAEEKETPENNSVFDRLSTTKAPRARATKN